MKHLLKELGPHIEKNRSIPFWSWNDKLDEKELLRQIDRMKQNGIGGFFMHARSGLCTEYLSEEWMRCVKACADHAGKLGMQAWVYDENGWPSGFAGGKLLEEPENHDRYLTYSVGEYDPDALVSYIVTDDELIRSNGGEEGEYLNVFEHLSTSTADILNPDVVRNFLDLTHERYKRYFGEEFSQKIKGFFSDEPQYFRWGIPYTVMIHKYFTETLKEDILDGLGLLFVKKNGYRRFRYLYWSGMQRLMLDGFAKMVYDWCEDNKLMLTGHYIEETSIGYQMMCCAGIMPFYEYEHIPGIDWLSRTCESPLSARQVTSAAAQLGRKQVLCEMYAGGGWDITPRELKRMTDYLYINGINLTCQHLLPYSERGNRIHDYPPHFSDINPWVKEYFGEFNEYFSRLGALISESEEQIRVAVLHPTRSAYFDYDRELEDDGFGVAELDQKLLELLYRLEGVAVGYHFIDETLLAKHGRVEGNHMICGTRDYDILIIPHCCTMDRKTEKMLCDYIKNGGRVFLDGERPTYLEWEPYDYSYLFSNITWQEIIASRPFNVSAEGGRFCATFRKFGDEDVILVHNHSVDERCFVSIEGKESFSAMRRVSLTDGKEEIIPLEFVLEPGETAVLIPEKVAALSAKAYEIVRPSGEYRVLYSDANSLTVDKLCYSVNGTDYTEPLTVPLAFRKLLSERYEGKLYLKYSFDADVVPSYATLSINTSGMCGMSVNGAVLDVEILNREQNIAEWLKNGKNDIVFTMDYRQNENVYYVMFGEDVTESLKNCLVYDSELEPLIIRGDFGVYESSGFTEDENGILFGESFTVAQRSDTVKSLVKDGYPFFAGKICLACDIECEGNNTLLELSGRWHAARVKVNGKAAGDMLFSDRLDISQLVNKGKNALELELVIGNRNLYGPHHFLPDPEPMMQGPDMFEFSDLDDGKGEKYRESMAFVEALCRNR